MPSVVFQVMSDLHLETPLVRPTYDESAVSITPQSPYLALIGDIRYTCDGRLFIFFEEQLRRFRIVFFLLSNHEAYGTSFVAAKAVVEAFAASIDEERRLSSEIGKFFFLDQSRYDIDEGMTVLGCTLYSHILKEQEETVKYLSRISRVSRIGKWTTITMPTRAS
jgi:hypothetical protein